jgi:hypothetical protein
MVPYLDDFFNSTRESYGLKTGHFEDEKRLIFCSFVRLFFRIEISIGTRQGFFIWLGKFDGNFCQFWPFLIPSWKEKPRVRANCFFGFQKSIFVYGEPIILFWGKRSGYRYPFLGKKHDFLPSETCIISSSISQKGRFWSILVKKDRKKCTNTPLIENLRKNRMPKSLFFDLFWIIFRFRRHFMSFLIILKRCGTLSTFFGSITPIFRHLPVFLLKRSGYRYPFWVKNTINMCRETQGFRKNDEFSIENWIKRRWSKP